MIRKLILTIACTFAWFTAPAQGATHLSLSVTVNLQDRILEVSGHADAPVTIPGEAGTGRSFSYNWRLPEQSEPQNWKGGPFVGEDQLYIPSGWYPHTEDDMTYDVQITSPVIAILPGKIAQEHISPSRYNAHFIMEKPTDGIPLFAGPYKITELQTEPVRLRTYFYEDMDALTKDYLQRSAKYIQRFERQIGPFPFEEFHIIAAPIAAGFGFPGLTYMSKRVLNLPFILESSLGHEIMHNYWGNGVFPDYQTGNWAEGLTTYLADYMTAEESAPAKARDMRLSWLRDYNALPANLDVPVTTFISKHGQSSQVIGYHKVAFIFHMLRRKLGDKAFFAGLRHFWITYAFKTASWQDLKDSFTQTTKQDLDPFFHQWVRGAGAPDFTSISARAQHHDGKGWDITTSVMQTPPAFNTDLPVSIGTGEGGVERLLPVSERLSKNTITTKQRPYALSLDPDFNIWRKLGPNEVPPILRDVMLAGDVDLIFAGSDEGVKQQGQTLATRMVEGSVHVAEKTDLSRSFILIGMDQEISSFLKQRKLPQPTFQNSEKATARIWADQLGQHIPYMVIALKDSTQIEALLRPLPHYGKYAQLSFQGAKAIWKSVGQSQPISVPIH